jgi:hypothetical protein
MDRGVAFSIIVALVKSSGVDSVPKGVCWSLDISLSRDISPLRSTTREDEE